MIFKTFSYLGVGLHAYTPTRFLLLFLILSNTMYGQICYIGQPGIDPGTTTCTPPLIVIDYVLTIDELLVAKFGGDVSRARDFAFQQAENGFEGLAQAANWAAIINHNLVQFPDVVVPSTSVTGFGPLSTYLRGEGFLSTPYDVHIHISGSVTPSGVNGETTGRLICEQQNLLSQGTCFIKASSLKNDETAKTVAHEVMHFLGREAHLDDPIFQDRPDCYVCGNVVNKDYLMCSYGGDYFLTPCDLSCLRLLVNEANCQCLAESFPSFPPSFIPGPNPKLTITSISHPLLGCKPGDETVECKVVFNNPTPNPIQKNVRILLNSIASSFFLPITNADFNSVVTVGQNVEARLLDAAGMEILHNIPANSSISFTFLCSLNIDQTTNQNPSIRTYSGSSVGSSLPDEISSVDIVVPITITGNQTLSTFGLNIFNKPVFIKSGTFTVDQIGGSQVPFSFRGPELIMGNGTKIIIANHQTLLNSISIHGCTEMWKGIEVNNGSELFMEGSFVCDAQFAVKANAGSSLVSKGNRFANNDVGMFMDGDANVLEQNNTFVTTFTGMLPPYPGQSPLPQSKGFCGILSQNAQFTSTGDHFLDLQNCIVSKNSTITINGAMMTDIEHTVRTGYGQILPAFTMPHTGIGVFGSGGQVTLQSSMIASAHTGAYYKSCTNNSHNNNIAAVRHGIRSFNGPDTHVQENEITAGETGIDVSFGKSTILNNKVIMQGSADAVGIRAGGSDFAPGLAALIAENYIEMTGGARAIHIPFSQGSKVTENNIQLSGGDVKGIELEGGYSELVNCNMINGGGTDGIYSLMAAWPNIRCNQTNGTNNGLHFDGSTSGKIGAYVAGNTLAGHATGLRLGAQATIGQQTHRGNRFIGVDAVHEGGAFAANKSKFIVNSQEDPSFLPYPVDPAGWFDDVPFEGLSYTCIDGISCPLPQTPPEYKLENAEAIILDSGLESSGHATQAWNSKVRLYQSLTTEANPWPTTSLISSFISTASSNDIGAFASMRSGIAQLLAAATPNYSLANTLLAQNQALASFQNYHLNEKTINAIVIGTLGIGNEPTEAQVLATKTIAALCPITDGEAVLRARALLYHWNAEIPNIADVCNQTEERASKKVASSTMPQITISPNPANAELRIKYLFSEPQQSRDLQIFDTFGRLIKSFTIVDLYGAMTLDVRDLNDGVYFLNATGTNQSRSFSVPFVIQH